MSIFLVNALVSWWKPIPAGDNPWDASSLEWATTSPPPQHNFLKIPPIRSQRPVWDHNHPEDRIIEREGPRLGALVASAGGGTVLLDEVGLVGADTIETRDPDR